MSQIRVIVVSAEEAYDGTAEFWCGGELMGVTMLSPGGLHCASTRAPMASRGSSTRSASRMVSTKRID